MTNIPNLQAATDVLYQYIPKAIQSVNWSFALEDMQDLMQQLGNPQEEVKVVHVAGTSGKTSTCYYIASMLHQVGKTVGLTVSPHVDSMTERVQVNGQSLSEDDFCKLLGQFLDIPAVKAARPTYFGLLVAFAYWVFAQKKLDYAVIEVGMGGRLDASNVVKTPNKLCVITDIGLDHIEMLGDNIVLIAAEKAGIIQKTNQVIVSQQDQSALDVIAAKATQEQAKLQIITKFDAPKELPLFQQRNWSVAMAAVGYLAERDNFEFNPQTSVAVKIPGRMEVFNVADKTVITDGAHNTQKITALCASLKNKYPNQKMAALVSFAVGKDTSLDASMALIGEVADTIIVTTFNMAQDVPKTSIDSTIVAKAAKQANIVTVIIEPDPVKAYKKLLELKNKTLLVTGSFYLLGHIRPLIKDTKND